MAATWMSRKVHWCGITRMQIQILADGKPRYLLHMHRPTLVSTPLVANATIVCMLGQACACVMLEMRQNQGMKEGFALAGTVLCSISRKSILLFTC